MNNVFLHFKSSVPHQLIINGNNLNLVNNIDKHSTDILLSNRILYVTYIPVSDNITHLPLSFYIKNNESLISSSKYVTIVPFGENHYEVHIKPFCYENYDNQVVLHSNSFDKYIINIINSDNFSNITINKESKLIYTKKTSLLSNAYSKLINNLVLIEGEENSKIFICVLDEEGNIIFEKEVDSISEESNTLKILKKVDDLVAHGIIYTLNLKTKDITTNLVYTYNNEPKDIKQDTLIPLAFLECIKIINLKQSKTYLIESLQNVTNSHFTEYFGNIEKIYFNPYILSQKYVNYVIFDGTNYKSYNFIVENFKIKDIEQVF